MEVEIEADNVSNLSIVSYGMADFNFEIFNGIYGAFFFIFWETEIGLNVWLVALAYTIYAIWNAVNDPLVGYFEDRPNRLWKRYGKRFPFVLIGGVPALLTLAAIFSPPYLDPVSGAWIYFVWILLFACSYEFFFTLIALSHSALYPDKFRMDNERRKVGAIQMALGLGGTTVGFILPPFFITYGDRASYMSMAWIFALIGGVIFLSMLPGHRESQKMKDRYILEQQNPERLSFIQAFKIILSRKNFIVVLLVLFMDAIIGASLTGSIHYVTKYILEEPAEMATLVLAGFIIGALGSIWPWLILSNKMKNHRRMLIIGVFLNTIFLLPFMFAHTLIAFVISALLLGIGGGALRVGRNPVFADTVDETTLKSGQHVEGAFMGVYTFFMRFALIAQGYIFAIVHQLTGFNPDAEHQTELAKFGILLHTAFIPMILCLIGLIVFVLVYNLTPERTKQIKEELKQKKL